MGNTVTDADRIAAEGVPIPTARGELRLLYGMRALRMLEDHYGGVGEMQEAMQVLMDNLTTTGKGKAFGPLCSILIPGLMHHGLTEDEALDALLPRYVKDYTEAMAEAMQQAFPDDPAPAGTGNDQAQQPVEGSPGPTGTTSPPAATAETMPDSGA